MDKIDFAKQVSLCMGCNYCRDAYGDEGWLESLKTKHICPVREELGFDSYTAKGRVLLARAIFEESIALSPLVADIFYKCALCGNCEAHCPSRGLPFVEADMRIRDLVKFVRRKLAQETEFSPAQLQRIGDFILRSKNVFNKNQDIRGANAKYMARLGSSARLIFFAGCMASFKIPSIIEAADRLFEKLAMPIGTLGVMEPCCGNILIQTGQESKAKKAMKRTYTLLSNLNIDILVTSCPGCLNMFRNEFPQFDLQLNCKIQHISEFINELLQKGKLKFENKDNITITYHDPCELGRASKVFDPPRNLLRSVPNIQLIEPFRTRENSWCCGAGGGLSISYKGLSKKIADARLKELNENNVDYIVTGCPTCKSMLNRDGNVLELSEFLVKFVKKP
jgi:Fe-S oxidoreductase